MLFVCFTAEGMTGFMNATIDHAAPSCADGIKDLRQRIADTISIYDHEPPTFKWARIHLINWKVL